VTLKNGQANKQEVYIFLKQTRGLLVIQVPNDTEKRLNWGNWRARSFSVFS
jgi:hypothetical protein